MINPYYTNNKFTLDELMYELQTPIKSLVDEGNSVNTMDIKYEDYVKICFGDNLDWMGIALKSYYEHEICAEQLIVAIIIHYKNASFGIDKNFEQDINLMKNILDYNMVSYKISCPFANNVNDKYQYQYIFLENYKKYKK